MENEFDIHRRSKSTYWIVSLVFVVLAASLYALTLYYWSNVLEPRLRSEAESQAHILAQSQTKKLADALVMNEQTRRAAVLQETINEVLLFSDPETGKPYFKGLDIDLDYDVIKAPPGSLNVKQGETDCRDCILSTNALFSSVTDEVIGVVRYRVNNSFFRKLSRDVKKTLLRQSHTVLLLLLIVWALIMILIKAINRSRHQAEIANRTKSAFLANMSHELRTPLNAIIGFSQLMSRDATISGEHRENLSIINRSGEYLLELINDVLQLSKIEAARDSLNETVFNFHATLENLEEMVRMRAEKKNLQLLFERHENVPRYIKGDEKKIRQILLNLLGNAIKFTDQGKVILRVKNNGFKGDGGEDTSCSLSFAIEDTGPGIPAEDKDMLFDAFVQANSGLRKQEGAGLGLSICRQLVGQMGGHLAVDSVVGKGTTFTFTLRVALASSFEAESAEPRKKVVGIEPDLNLEKGNGYRILVADDNKDNCRLLCTLLQQVGFSVKEAENGRQAVEVSRSWRPHLIWMDMVMPEMDGYEATKNIRTLEPDNQPVIIALTASAFEEDRSKVLAAGCDDFVRRPFREAEIFEKMKHHLGLGYIYEDYPDLGPEDSGVRLSDETLVAAVEKLPEQVARNLKLAVELSDMEKINQIVKEMQDQDKSLAKVFKEYIDAFQYDKILAILEKGETPE